MKPPLHFCDKFNLVTAYNDCYILLNSIGYFFFCLCRWKPAQLLIKCLSLWWTWQWVQTSCQPGTLPGTQGQDAVLKTYLSSPPPFLNTPNLFPCETSLLSVPYHFHSISLCKLTPHCSFMEDKLTFMWEIYQSWVRRNKGRCLCNSLQAKELGNSIKLWSRQGSRNEWKCEVSL